jgi:hypothetical protein
MQTIMPTEVRVDCDRGGGWEVTLPDVRERVRCRSLDEARRVAQECAAQMHPCRLIVHDAYHRVLVRELIDGDE